MAFLAQRVGYFRFTSAGALYDPTPAPTATITALDGTPGAATLVKQGSGAAARFYVDLTETLPGLYEVLVGTTDVAADVARFQALAEVPATILEDDPTNFDADPNSLAARFLAMAAKIGQIDVNAVVIDNGFDADTNTLTLRYANSYTDGLDSRPIVIPGLNNYDLTAGSVDSVVLSVKLKSDVGKPVKPIFTLSATTLAAHTATFNFTNSDMRKIYPTRSYVWDILLTLTDKTTVTLIYGDVVVEDAVSL